MTGFGGELERGREMGYSGLDVLTIVHFGNLYVFGFDMRNSKLYVCDIYIVRDR